jgi:hypothetical protein
MNIPPEQKFDKEAFQAIFIDHWDEFKKVRLNYDTPQYEVPVQKMLGCGLESGGYSEYRCVNCGLGVHRIAFTCKSCFCLSCSKKYVDDFVSQVSGMLHPGVVYRHIVLTIPEQLRLVFYNERHDGSLLSAFMRCGHECLEDVVSTALRKLLKIGTIVVVQTHGRSGRYNPHLHIIMTSGGINEGIESWFDLRYFKYEIIHKKWQYHLFGMLKSWFSTKDINTLIDELWSKYPNGLVANVSKGNVPESCGGLARYLAKYVASPPIAVRRIINYDGHSVTYWYKDHKTKSKKVETVSAFVFIGRMVQHIMPKGFQRVRYYGLQATKTFKQWANVIRKGIQNFGRAIKGTYQIVRTKKYREHYFEINSVDPMKCDRCGCEMVLWKIWHPKYGTLYDEFENLKKGKYGTALEPEYYRGVDGCEEENCEEGRGRSNVWPTSSRIQIPLFSMSS